MTIYTRWSRNLREVLEPPVAEKIFFDGWDVRFFEPKYIQDLMSAYGAYNIVKRTKSTKETEAFIFTVNENLFFLKKIDFKKKKLETRFRYLFQPSRSFWSAYAAFKLVQSGFLTPEVYAVGERRRGLMIEETYIINEALPNARSGVEKQLELGLDLNLLYDAGIFLRNFHNSGFYHGDMQFSNFYLHQGKIGVWDLDSVQIYEGDPLPVRKRMIDLGRLFSSFVQLVDSAGEEGESYLDVTAFAESLGQGYGIQPRVLIENFNTVWARTFKIKHRLKV